MQSETGITVSGRLDSVQLLRAIAAMAVVFVHAPLKLFDGGWGVDLFFVISGFIMCYVTEHDAKDFLLKRAIRIVPLYWLGTFGLYFVVLAVPQLFKNTSTSPVELLKSLLFIPFLKGSVVKPVLFLGWTLNMEVYFYLLFALSMTISHRYRGILCSALILMVMLIGRIFPHQSVALDFYSNSVVLDFVMGMGCWPILKWLARRGLLPTTVMARGAWLSVGVLAIASLVVLMNSLPREIRVSYQGLVFGIPSAVCFLGFVVGLIFIDLPRRLTILGDASYSLYLFHPYITEGFSRVLPGADVPNLQGYATLLFLLILCSVVAIGIYQYFEKPITNWLRKRLLGSSSRRTALAAR